MITATDASVNNTASAGDASATDASTTATTTDAAALASQTDETASGSTTDAAVGSAVPTATSATATITPVPSLDAEASPEPTTRTSSMPAPQTIEPIGSDTETSQWLPTSIVTESKLSTATSARPTSTSSLPEVITFGGAMPERPENMTLVQVGFLYGLNYPFVVSSQVSVAQIFEFLPRGIADGLAIPLEQVMMHSLRPYDTTKDGNYITTLALFYVPSDMVNTLDLDLGMSASKLYQHRDPSVSALMGMIDPSFPILAYHSRPGIGRGNGRNPSSNPGPGEDGSPLAPNSANAKVSPTTIGFLVGGIAGVAAYGAAMFIIARRYRQRHERHQRASSNADYDRNVATGPLMAGGLRSSDRYSPPHPGRLTPGDGRNSRGSGRSGGTSARTQQISAPMMAENSLGW